MIIVEYVVDCVVVIFSDELDFDTSVAIIVAFVTVVDKVRDVIDEEKLDSFVTDNIVSFVTNNEDMTEVVWIMEVISSIWKVGLEHR